MAKLDRQNAERLAWQYLLDKNIQKNEVSLFKKSLTRLLERRLAHGKGVVWKDLSADERKDYQEAARWHVNRLNRVMDGLPGDGTGLLSMKTMKWTLDDYRRFVSGVPQAEIVANAAYGLQELYQSRVDVCRRHGVHPLSDEAGMMENFMKEFAGLLPHEKLEVVKRAEADAGTRAYAELRADIESDIAEYDSMKRDILDGKEDRCFQTVEGLDEAFSSVGGVFGSSSRELGELDPDAYRVLLDAYVGMRESEGVSLRKLARISPKKAREFANVRKRQSLLVNFTKAAVLDASRSKKLN